MTTENELDLDDLLGELELDSETEAESIASQEAVDSDIYAQERQETDTEPVQNLIEDPGVQYSQDFLEVQRDTKEYMENIFEIESEIKALKSKMKDLKSDAKEIGVPVSAVGKAVKEMIKEIKETPDEAKNIEEVKRFIKEDNYLYSEVSGMAQD